MSHPSSALRGMTEPALNDDAGPGFSVLRGMRELGPNESTGPGQADSFLFTEEREMA